MVTVSADTTVTATFMADLTVTASVSGGNGTVSPATQAVHYGSSATITITPDTGRHVSSILDTISSSTGRSTRKSAATTMSKTGASSTGSYVINNVTTNHAVTVTFVADSETLTATKTGNGTLTASGLTCAGSTCTGTYSHNTPVTIRATAGSGYALTGWTGCDSNSGNTCTIAMTSARSVTATFTVSGETLTVTKSGTVTVETADLTITQKQTPCSITIYPHNDVVYAVGGSGSFTVTAPTGCGWKVEADSKAAGWLSATPGSGTESGPVSYAALGNGTNRNRTGKLTISLTDTPSVKKVFTVTEKR